MVARSDLILKLWEFRQSRQKLPTFLPLQVGKLWSLSTLLNWTRLDFSERKQRKHSIWGSTYMLHVHHYLFISISHWYHSFAIKSLFPGHILNSRDIFSLFWRFPSWSWIWSRVKNICAVHAYHKEKYDCFYVLMLLLKK